ncbi:MAG TPA: 16S rRNA (adenine(1518)-N(6)/adenine(1519)-N(6))-dimethyltransferase, partial [Ruminococcaceae bacterium]|nr:16S rRNA (adenine(1518)-N(6)/adenine(1519)-N(6))-dimethyltransferase [Oscillospiraceae bacterium]
AITVMVQKEAAARICAEPGSRNAGALSAAVSYYAKPQVLFSVSRGSFMPAPEVDSAVIRLDVRPEPAVVPRDEKLFFQIIRAGFSQRRKTLLNSLSAGLPLTKEKTACALERAQIRPAARAEELTLEDFCRLTEQVFEEIFGQKV